MTAERQSYLEVTAENYALQFLKLGRANWDEPHTRAVVYYAKLVGRAEGLDVTVLAVAAWLHDIGYYGEFSEGESKKYDVVMNRKEAHMVKGARIASEFVNSDEMRDLFTEEQRQKIVHLVFVHDKIEELSDPYEIVLMEADTLGAIDITKVTPSFDKKNGLNYVENDLKWRRLPMFQTETGKTLAKDLVPKMVEYFENLPN